MKGAQKPEAAPDWITLETNGPGLACWRCGRTSVVVLPSTAAAFDGVLHAFIAEHRPCQERTPRVAVKP